MWLAPRGGGFAVREEHPCRTAKAPSRAREGAAGTPRGRPRVHASEGAWPLGWSRPLGGPTLPTVRTIITRHREKRAKAAAPFS